MFQVGASLSEVSARDMMNKLFRIIVVEPLSSGDELAFLLLQR